RYGRFKEQFAVGVLDFLGGSNRFVAVGRQGRDHFRNYFGGTERRDSNVLEHLSGRDSRRRYVWTLMDHLDGSLGRFSAEHHHRSYVRGSGRRVATNGGDHFTICRSLKRLT